MLLGKGALDSGGETRSQKPAIKQKTFKASGNAVAMGGRGNRWPVFSELCDVCC